MENKANRYGVDGKDKVKDKEDKDKNVGKVDNPKQKTNKKQTNNRILCFCNKGQTLVEITIVVRGVNMAYPLSCLGD